MNYAKKCSITSEEMNEGWVANDGELYFKYKVDMLEWIGKQYLSDAYDNGIVYWTEWEEGDK